MSGSLRIVTHPIVLEGNLAGFSEVDSLAPSESFVSSRESDSAASLGYVESLVSYPA